MMLYKVLSCTDIKKNNIVVISLVESNGEIKNKIKALDIPVYSLGIRRKSVLSFYKLLNLIIMIHRVKPDIIQGWMYHGNLAATLAGIFAIGHPAVVWNIRHSLYDLNYEKRFTRWVIHLNRIFSRSPKAIIYNSNISRQQHEAFGFHSNNSQVIPNGIDHKRFSISALNKQNIRSELDIPSSAVVVGHIARFHPLKDHKGFLQAAVKIAQMKPEIHFVLIGRDISIENKLLTGLIPDAVSEQFHLLGEQKNIPELMNIMDVFCLSSAWGEGWPNVLGEAMAAGKPCVATDVGDSKEIVGNTGIIVPPRDAGSLRSGIEELAKMTPEQRRILGKKARNRIIEKYDLNMIVDQYASLYSELLLQ